MLRSVLRSTFDVSVITFYTGEVVSAWMTVRILQYPETALSARIISSYS
ncbi:major capsid protein [Salmonella phage 21]|nr:major capsid protein [Salmonella phage 21]